MKGPIPTNFSLNAVQYEIISPFSRQVIATLSHDNPEVTLTVKSEMSFIEEPFPPAEGEQSNVVTTSFEVRAVARFSADDYNPHTWDYIQSRAKVYLEVIE